MNNKILITGASNGLGYYLAHYLYNKGHPLIIHGRNKDRLEIEK